MFGEEVPTQETGDPTQPEEPSEGEGEGEGEAPSGSAAEQAAQLLDEATQLFVDAGAALEDQDFARYGDLQEQAEEKVAEASEILGAGGSGSSPTTTTTTEPASDESAAAAADVLSTFDATTSSSPTTTTTTEPPEPLARGA
jgi:hypothetical protein